MNTQLENLKTKLENPTESDDVLLLYLRDAGDIICEIRNSNKVEKKYLGTQVDIAVEFYNKIGAEGQVSHTENGIARVYEKSDVSDSLLRRITPMMKTPFSKVRVIED